MASERLFALRAENGQKPLIDESIEDIIAADGACFYAHFMDAVDDADGGIGMNRCPYAVACRCRAYGGFSRFPVADFTDKENIGVRTHEAGKGIFELLLTAGRGGCLGEHVGLTDTDNGVFRRIFQRPVASRGHVLRHAFHDVFERGAFAVAGRPADYGESGMFRETVNHILLLGSEAESGQSFMECAGSRCRIEKQTHGKANARFGNERTLDRFAVQTDGKQTIGKVFPVGYSAVVSLMGAEGGFRLGEVPLKDASDELETFFPIQRLLFHEQTHAAERDLSIRPHVGDVDVRSLLFHGSRQKVHQVGIDPRPIFVVAGKETAVANAELLLKIAGRIP